MQPWERQRMLRRGRLGSRERLLPVGRKEPGHRQIFTRGGLILPGSAVSQHRVAMDEHPVIQAWILGRERGEVPGLRRNSSQNYTKPQLHPTKSRLYNSSYWKHPNQCFRSICKQPGMGMEGRGGGLRQQTTKLEGRNPVYVSTPKMLRIRLCFIPATLCVLLSTPADCRTIRTLAEHF